MDQKSESTQSTPRKFDADRDLHAPQQRHIQVNLSKEYFTSLMNEEDNASIFTDDSKKESPNNENMAARNTLSGYNERLSDAESGITPIAQDNSPIKGIIKNTTEIHGVEKNFNYADSPKSVNSSPRAVKSPKSPKSPKKVRITEPYHEKQFTTGQTIAEMDGLRTQLRHMIELTQLQNTSSNVQRDFKKGDAIKSEISAVNDGNPTSNLSAISERRAFENIGPSRGMLSYTSPPLEMDENGIMRRIDFGHLSNMEKSAFDYASSPTDRFFMFENTFLKENLEKEEQRRKHCEDQIQNLQKKILEMQQQLAVAVATDRKKAMMIEQLDKTLGNIVVGWKKQDSERAKVNQKLKDENQSLRKSQNKQQELLGQFEKELAQAVESLTREQSKTKAAEQDKEDQLKHHEQQREEAYEKLQNEIEIANGLRQDVEKLESEKNELCRELKELEEGIDEERKAWLEEREEVFEETSKEKDRLRQEINQLQQLLATSKEETQEANKKISSHDHELQKVMTELDTASREKETMKIELALLEAKIETLRAKQESETRAVLEQEFNQRINIIQDEIMRTERQLKEAHKEQMAELNQRHKEDLELQLKRFHEELNKRESMTRKMKEDFELRLSDAQSEVVGLKSSKAKLEVQRTELTRRLQALMQQHIQEAVSLLSLENGSQTPKALPDRLAQVLTYQIQNPLNESVISDVHKDTNLNPFSSTFSEAKDYSSASKNSMAYNRSKNAPSESLSTSKSTIRADSISQRNPNVASLLSNQGGDSVHDIWQRLSQFHSDDEAIPIHGQKAREQPLNAAGSDDSVLLREQRFQAGLQNLSDKLRRSDLNNTGAQGQTPFADVNRQRSWREEELPQGNQLEEIQQLLKSKLDEVKDYGRHFNEEESLLHEQLAEERQHFERDARIDEIRAENEYREQTLNSFIKKLLDRSSVPSAVDDNDYEDNLLDQRNAPDEIGHKHESRDTSKPKHLEYLPIGSDSVSKDSIEGNLKTPPKASRITSLAPAFKKSVLRERPSYGQHEEQEINNASPERKSPRKAFESQSDSVNEAKMQLIGLMRALGIQDDRQAMNVDEIVEEFLDAGTSQNQEKRKLRRNSNQDNAKRPPRPSGPGPAGRAQLHPKQKQKGQVDVFSRLQKIYGNSEKQSMNLNADEQLGRIQGPKAPKSSISHPTKQTRPRDQKKAQANARSGSNVWK